MTNKEALKELTRQVKCWKNGTSFAYNIQPLEVAVCAIKKQIPQELDWEGDGYDDSGELIYDTAYCRECRHMFEVDYDEHANFCPNCGQALDWGDAE